MYFIMHAVFRNEDHAAKDLQYMVVQNIVIHGLLKGKFRVI